MAVYRQVHTTFWTDPDILEWSPEEKYFYLYLMTNPYTNQTGIYEISKKMMSMQLGYPIDTVSIHIQSLIKRSKIRYSDDTKEVYLINWIKYNKSTSPKVITLIDKELETVKNQSFANDYHQRCCLMGIKLKPLSIQYPYSIHTHPQKEQEQEQEREKEEEKEKEQQQEMVTVIGNIFQEYEKCGFGLASSVQAEMLMDFEKTYGYEMTVDALKESAKNNVLKLSYAEGILKNWKVNGRRNKVEPGGQNKESTEQPRRKYGKQRTDEELDAIDVNDPSII